MNDECKTTKVLLQENGIVRDIETGNIIGRLTYLEHEDDETDSGKDAALDRLITNQQDCPPEFSQAVSDHFDELID